jgi:hypothetical protein
MKRNIYLFTIFLMIGFAANAQTQFWIEDFGTNPVCASSQVTAFTSTNGAWTNSVTGTNQTFANVWYVSPAEAGMGVGICGDGCGSNPTLINRTLHISTNPSLFGDIGSAYVAGSGANTNIRAQSPTINCSGKSGIVLKFNYIHWGIVNQDFMEVNYSADNGVTWSSLGIPAQTPTVSCSGQGIWTAASYTLPATANNNPTVKIGFRWQNINASGSDPSCAVDDIAATYSAVVSPSLTPTFTLPTSICRGDSTQVTANTGTMVASGYTWTASPAGPLIATPNASVTWVKFPTVGTFSIFLTAQSGTQVASVNHTILVNPTPTITPSSNPSVMCNGSSATLTASGGLSYTWTPPGSTVNPIVVSPTVNATYQVVGTNTFGCKGYASITVTVNPKPNVAVTSSTMNVCQGSTATLTATGASTYTWSPNTANGAVVVITPTAASTTYTVIGTSSLGCTNSNTITITTSTCGGSGMGVHAYVANELPFSVFPNPAKDKISIKAGSVNLTNVKVELFDLLGKKVAEQNFASITAGSEQSMQVSTLPKGIFILSMSVDGVQQKAIRLVKE